MRCIKLVEYCLYHELVINMSGPFCHAMDTMNGISISPPHRPSFAGLRICNEPIASDAVVESEVSPAITTSDGPAPVGEIEGPLADDFGRVSIAYCEDPSGQNPFLAWDAAPRLCVSVGARTEGGSDGAPSGSRDMMDETGGDEVRKGGRRKLVARTSSLIDPAGFDPTDDAFSYEVLRRDLQQHIAVAGAVARRVGGEDEGGAELDEGEEADEEVVQEAIEYPSGFAGDVADTVDSMLLLCAFKIYYYNGTYRNQVKVSDDDPGDVEEEMLARWSLGNMGRGKARARSHPKVETVDRMNFGRALGTMPPAFKEGASERIAQLVEMLSELTDWNEDAATELADRLVEFDDDMCAPCSTPASPLCLLTLATATGSMRTTGRSIRRIRPLCSPTRRSRGMICWRC